MADIQLTDEATQSGFARLVGVSRQAINKLCEKGDFPEGGDYHTWLTIYVDRLRENAAGRGGDSQATLTQMRIMEAQENVAEKRQRRLAAAGELMDRETVFSWVTESGANIQGFMLDAGETIFESVSEKYSIELEADDVFGPIRTALRHAGEAGQELAGRFAGLAEESSSELADSDGLMG